MTMFIQDEDVVEIKIYCKRNGHKFIAYSEKEFNKVVKEENKAKYECLSVKMKELSWGTYNMLQEEAMVENSEHERVLNYKMYKENKLRKLIKEWDAKSKDGKPVPVNETAIARLAPPIAETILRAYDELSFLGEEDEKN